MGVVANLGKLVIIKLIKLPFDKTIFIQCLFSKELYFHKLIRKPKCVSNNGLFCLGIFC